MAPLKINVDLDQRRIELGITLLALSNTTGIPRSTLRRKLANPGQLSLDELAAVTRDLLINDDDLKVVA